MKKYSRYLLFFTSLLTVIVFISACGTESTSSEKSGRNENTKKELRIGFMPGPYIDEFKLGIEPALKEKGYTIQYENLNDGVQTNLAVAKNELDANIFQHSVYLESINKKENINLTGVVQVPTPPMGLYSKKYRQTKEIKDGVEVAMPSDPVNMARALIILNELGWITLKKGVDPLKVSDHDIIDNPHNIKITPMDSAMGPRALEDVDYVAIQGNFAVSSGLKLKDALILENMTSPYINVVAVKQENKEEQFVKDIVSAYHSKAFQDAITSEEQFDGYKLPDYFK
jgi:D-methionine transport system substrate-binding protein